MCGACLVSVCARAYMCGEGEKKKRWSRPHENKWIKKKKCDQKQRKCACRRSLCARARACALMYVCVCVCVGYCSAKAATEAGPPAHAPPPTPAHLHRRHINSIYSNWRMHTPTLTHTHTHAQTQRALRRFNQALCTWHTRTRAQSHHFGNANHSHN